MQETTIKVMDKLMAEKIVPLFNSIQQGAGRALFVAEIATDRLQQVNDDYTKLRLQHLEKIRQNSILRIEVDTYKNGRFCSSSA